MTTWRIGDLGKVVTGRTPPSSKPECFGEEFPFITPTDMDDRKTIRTTERYLSSSGHSLLLSSLLPAKCVSVSCIGWQMGKSVLTSRPSFTNQQLNSIIPDHSKVDAHYLYYALTTRREEFKRLGSVGTRTPILNKSAFCAMEVELPDLANQRRIAAILSAYDDLIENNIRRIKILEDMAQTLYREWFVNFRFPGHEMVRMVESELGPIPEGCSVQPLEKIVEDFIDYRGKTPKKLGADWSESGVLALSALNVKQGRLVSLEKAKFVSEELYEKWMKTKLRAGDILMTSEAPLGELYFLPETRRYCLSQRVFSIRSKATLMQPSLLFFAMSSPEGQKRVKARASGTTVLGIRQAELRQIPILCPPTDLQRSGDGILRPYLRLIDVLQRKTDNLRTTRDFLLPKLISGAIPVEATANAAAETVEELMLHA